jgi:hypothetical protein
MKVLGLVMLRRALKVPHTGRLLWAERKIADMGIELE